MARRNPPTVRMRRLGAQLRQLREERGLTLDAAEDLLKYSKSALNRMENAQVITRQHDVEYILWKYEVTDRALRESLLGLASAGRSKDWVKRNANLAPGPMVKDFVTLEQDAVGIRTFQPILIPGLLQTPDYARAVIMSGSPDPARDVDRSVAYRMARQEVLTRPHPAHLKAVIGEAALRQRLGSAEVMRDQLLHLIEASRKRNITIHALPYEATRNPGSDGPFTLLDVETGMFTIAVIEGLTRSIYIEDETEIIRYNMTLDDLCVESLQGTDSQALIRRIVKDLEAFPAKERHDHMAEKQP